MFVTRCKVIGLSCAAMLLMRCATVKTPPHWLPSIDEVQQQAYGGWLTVYSPKGADKANVEGELIAVQEESLYIHTGSQVVQVPQTEVWRATLAIYRNQATGAGIGTLLGTLSTISHGFYLMFSAPLWIIAGTAMTVTESYGGFLEYPKTSWKELRKFARFPQGLPHGLDLKQIKPRFNIVEQRKDSWRRGG